MENYQLFLKLSDQLKSLSTRNLPVDNVPTLKVSADFQTTYEASVSGVQSGFKHLSKENIAYPPHCWLDAALARQIAIHIMIEKFDIPRRQIARELERIHTIWLVLQLQPTARHVGEPCNARYPMSDGCTGFQFLEYFFDIRQCCVVHDAGGSDGFLLDCLMNNTPPWSWVLVALCVAVMIFFRPLYRWLKNAGYLTIRR